MKVIGGNFVTFAPLALLGALVFSQTYGTITTVTVVMALICLAIIIATLAQPIFSIYFLAIAGLINIEFFLGTLLIGTTTIATFLVLPALLRALIQHLPTVPKSMSFATVTLIGGATIAAFNQGLTNEEVTWGVSRWVIFSIIVVGIILILRSSPHKSFKYTQILFVASGVIISLLGVAQGIGMTRVVGTPVILGRADSTFNWYSNYAQFLSLAILIAIGIIMSTEYRTVTRVLVFLSVILMLTETIQTSSRGAILALLAGFLFLFVCSAKSIRSLTRTALVTLTLFIAGLVITPPAALVALEGRLGTQQAEDNYRESLQQTGLEALQREPLGLGFGQFQSYILSNLDLGARAALAHPHNLFTSVGVEAGLLGMAGFLALVAGVLLNAFRREWGRIGSWTTRLGASMALAGALAQGFVDYFFYEQASMVAFAMVLAFSQSIPGVAVHARTRLRQKPTGAQNAGGAAAH